VVGRVIGVGNEIIYTLSLPNSEESAMPKEAVFTMKLEPELRDAFMAEAEAADRPASQIIRELMRDYVKRQREAREYDDFLRRKVEIARTQIRGGLSRSNDEVSAEFAESRAELLRKAEEADEGER
jgi:hypothetical protein